MSRCKRCSRDYSETSYQYCLDCGASLNDGSEAPTRIKDAANQPASNRTIDERQVQSALEAIFQLDHYDELRHDARFERFIGFMKEKHSDELIPMLMRIIGRAEQVRKKGGIYWDSIELERACELSPEAAYRYLQKSGIT